VLSQLRGDARHPLRAQVRRLGQRGGCAGTTIRRTGNARKTSSVRREPVTPIAYDGAVTAPVVVILAAGEGTRMRSEKPKLLHEICGWPMIAWPVAAASEAGAGKIVVVEGPRRELEGVLDRDAGLDGVLEFGVQ